MEIKRYTSPFDCDKVIALWADIFGEYEAELERVQCNGSETDSNTDVVYTATEDGKILGVVHFTVSRQNPKIAGMSGVCTIPEARGKGISRKLFKMAMDEIDSMGVKACFLGTGHPSAIRIYAEHGFSFITCTGAMARFSEGDFCSYTQELFRENPKKITIVNASSDMRLHVIPFAYCTFARMMVDVNAEIAPRGWIFSQVSCMGLFQKYLDVKKNGGDFIGAINEEGVLGAMATAMPTADGIRVDFAAVPVFGNAGSLLIDEMEKRYGKIYLQIADADETKLKIAESIGFKKGDEVMQRYRGCIIPMHIYER